MNPLLTLHTSALLVLAAPALGAEGLVTMKTV